GNAEQALGHAGFVGVADSAAKDDLLPVRHDADVGAGTQATTIDGVLKIRADAEGSGSRVGPGGGDDVLRFTIEAGSGARVGAAAGLLGVDARGTAAQGVASALEASGAWTAAEGAGAAGRGSCPTPRGAAASAGPVAGG